MFISTERKWIFMNIPGCVDSKIDSQLSDQSNIMGMDNFDRSNEDITSNSNSSTSNSFFKYDNIRDIKLNFNNHVSEDWTYYYKFTFIKNPWKRTYDLYNMYCRMRGLGIKAVIEVMSNINSFEEFISCKHLLCGNQYDYIYKTPDQQKWSFNNPFVTLNHSQDIINLYRCGGSLVNSVFNVDNGLNEKSKKILSKFGISLDYEGGDYEYRDMYSKSMRKSVAKFFEDDINFFMLKF